MIKGDIFVPFDWSLAEPPKVDESFLLYKTYGHDGATPEGRVYCGVRVVVTGLGKDFVEVLDGGTGKKAAQYIHCVSLTHLDPASRKAAR